MNETKRLNLTLSPADLARVKAIANEVECRGGIRPTLADVIRYALGCAEQELGLSPSRGA